MIGPASTPAAASRAGASVRPHIPEHQGPWRVWLQPGRLPIRGTLGVARGTRAVSRSPVGTTPRAGWKRQREGAGRVPESKLDLEHQTSRALASSLYSFAFDFLEDMIGGLGPGGMATVVLAVDEGPDLDHEVTDGREAACLANPTGDVVVAVFPPWARWPGYRPAINAMEG